MSWLETRHKYMCWLEIRHESMSWLETRHKYMCWLEIRHKYMCWLEIRHESMSWLETRHYMLFTFLPVDMEILTPLSSQVQSEAQPKVYRVMKGVRISISTDRIINNDFIPGYSQK